MKQTLILLIGVVILSCNQNQRESPKSKEKAAELVMNSGNFDWLLGNWERLNEEDGKVTFENWKKISVKEYSGIGFTMQNGDTLKQEKIQLIKTDEKWNLVVKVPDEAEAITFKMTQFNEKEFVCENHEIDFPNKIRYWKKGDRINASVSNSEMEILFEFERISK